MPAPNILRAKQREEIKPLIDELNRAFSSQKRTDIALMSGLTNYQVGRILGDYLPAPTYLDITRLLQAADISPNEAAKVVGLYEDNQNADTVQSAYERRLLRLLRNAKLGASQRSILMQVLEATVHGLEGQAQLEETAEVPVPATSRRRNTGS